MSAIALDLNDNKIVRRLLVIASSFGPTSYRQFHYEKAILISDKYLD